MTSTETVGWMFIMFLLITLLTASVLFAYVEGVNLVPGLAGVAIISGFGILVCGISLIMRTTSHPLNKGDLNES